MARRSLFGTVLFTMAASAGVPAVLLSAFSLRERSESLVDSAQRQARLRAERSAAEVAARVARPLEEIARALARPGFSALGPEDQRRELKALLSAGELALAVSVTDGQGEPIVGLQAAVRDLPAEEMQAHAAAARAAVAQGIEGLVRGPVSPSRGAGTVLRVARIPGAGQWAIAQSSLAPFQGAAAARRAPAQGRSALVDSQLALLAGPELEQVRAAAAFAPADPALARVAALSGAPLGVPVAVELAGAGTLLAAAPVAGTPWIALDEQPLASAYCGVRAMYVAAGGLVALVLGVAAAFGFAVTRRILRPVKDLEAMAMEIAQGRFGAQAKVHRRDEIGGLAEVFNYMSQQLLALDSETRRLYESLEEGYLETMLVLAHSIDTKDSYTHGHSRRVGELAAEIGKELGLPQFELRQLMYGGLLHDIGKIGVVEPILHKNSKLTTEEMDAMRAHPSVGASILESASFLKPILPAVRHHHERWDGTGYPDGLKGEEIPLAARIVGAADTWDACTSLRTYQEPMPPAKALEVVLGLKGKQLDPKVADALERVIRRRVARGERQSAGEEPLRSHG